MISQPPSEGTALRRPLFACLLIGIGYTVFQAQNPFVQIVGLLIATPGCLTLIQLAWAKSLQRRELQRHMTALAEQGAKQETRRERRTRRREVTRDERVREVQRKEREAQERKARQEQEKEALLQRQREAQEQERVFNTEVDRLLAYSTADRRREFCRIMQAQGYRVESEKPTSLGSLITLQDGDKTACAVLIEIGKQRTERDISTLLEIVASSACPVQWVACFDGFATELVLALNDKELRFIDTFQLAQWSLKSSLVSHS